MKSRLILICAGGTEAARKARFAGDEPVEPKWAGVAAELAPHLPRAGQVWCSPALRARQTAEALGLSAVEVAALRDQAFGDWAGKSLAEVEAGDPAGFMGWLTDPALAPPGGEAMQDVAVRIAAVLDGLRAVSGVVIAVTHPAVIRAAVVQVLGAPLQTAARMDVEPLSLTDLRSDGRRWMLRATGVPAQNGRI